MTVDAKVLRSEKPHHNNNNLHVTWGGAVSFFPWANNSNNEGDDDEKEEQQRLSMKSTISKQDLAVLQKRQLQVEEELAHIKRQIALSASDTADSLREGTTASTCDCAVPLKNGGCAKGGQVPYGTMDDDCQPVESSPLLNEVPPEHILIGGSGEHHEWEECFSNVRSEEDLENEKVHNESEFYLNSSMFARAIPERLFALMVTMILEIPVLLMISGGSDALCMLIGRRRYQLLIGFLPLTSAISGNVGLQASTLTTRAISHLHVTPNSYMHWLITEIGAALHLGAGMGLVLGSIAFWAAGMDLSFGLTIAIAQLLSVLTAGCTGTLAPLLFSFIFRRDSGKWGGPLETAIQDIVGSFAMVVVSYHVLLWLGPGPIQPGDSCGR